MNVCSMLYSWRNSTYSSSQFKNDDAVRNALWVVSGGATVCCGFNGGGGRHQGGNARWLISIYAP